MNPVHSGGLPVDPIFAAGLLPPRSGPLAALPQTELLRLFARPGEHFTSEHDMRGWLTGKGIDCNEAHSNKGLNKLFEKIEKGEAHLIHDEQTGCVYRNARVARIGVEAMINGQLYPVIELCQIFLDRKLSHAALVINDPAEAAQLIQGLNIRGAQVRNSQQLWETLVGEEDARAGAHRGLCEELGLTVEEADKANLLMRAKTFEYEAPIDWPGIHSILEINSAVAVLPQEIAKPAYAEVEAGDQVTIFVATPGTPVLRALLGAVLPNIRFMPE